MNLQGQRTIPASAEATWAALNDPETLKACIAGCESLEKTGDNEYLATMAVRIGPVNARFKGRLQLQNIVPISSYTIAFDGQGGVAGFGKGTADVTLTPDGDATRLGYSAKAQVGGKLAQVGSRLIDSAAAKIADDFFAAFEARLASPAAAATAVESADTSDNADTPGAMAFEGAAAGGFPGAAEAASEIGIETGNDIRDLSRPGRPDRPVEIAPHDSGRSRWTLWALLVVVVLALLVYLVR